MYENFFIFIPFYHLLTQKRFKNSIHDVCAGHQRLKKMTCFYNFLSMLRFALSIVDVCMDAR